MGERSRYEVNRLLMSLEDGRKHAFLTERLRSQEACASASEFPAYQLFDLGQINLSKFNYLIIELNIYHMELFSGSNKIIYMKGCI